MNQGIAFSRTLRALEAGDFRASKSGLLAAALLLAAWTWWMFSASIPRYETTTRVQIESGQAIAYFSPGVLARLHEGQPAILHFDGTMFPARVQSVGSEYASIALNSGQPPPGPWKEATAEIEVSSRSPASLVFQLIHNP
jgi:hypothetical protein